METAAFQHFMDQLDELGEKQRQVLTQAITFGGSGEDILEMIDTRFEAAPVCGHCGDLN